MSDRKGHYLKPGVRASCPYVWLSVHVETVDTPKPNYPHLIDRSFGRAAVSVSYRRGNRWSDPISATLPTAESVRLWVGRHAVAGRRNWVVCPIASDVLTLIGWWDHVDSVGASMANRTLARKPGVDDRKAVSGCVFDGLVVRGTPDIISYSYKGKTYRWVSGRQYYPEGAGTGSPDVAAHVGDRGAGGADASAAPPRAEDVCRGWLDRMRSLSDWWLGAAKTTFGCTVGQMSVGMLRSYQTEDRLCTHRDEDAHRLERASAYGGRAQCWYTGQIGPCDTPPREVADREGRTHVQRIDGPVYHLDVRSMYPHLMRSHIFPCKISYYRENVPVKECLEMCANWGVLANVTGWTSRPEYPQREGAAVTYPVGALSTTLTGPELLKLAADGEILTVNRMAVYRPGRPFTAFADALLRLRTEARTDKRSSDEAFAKLLANSLCGKLAQRRGGWERDAAYDEPRKWGESYEVDVESGRTTRYRHIAGLGWRWHDDESGAGPWTFAFSYLCAYGRLMMRAIREQCPSGTVVSQDTDGLWVTRTGMRALLTIPGLVGEGMGQLSHKRTCDTAQFWGPRHYRADDDWTLAGFHNPTVDGDSLKITDTFDTSLWARRERTAPTTVATTVRYSSLSLDIGGASVAPDGWAEPRIRKGPGYPG